MRVGIDLLLIVILHAASTQTAGSIRAIEQPRPSSATHLILLDRQVTWTARGQTKVARISGDDHRSMFSSIRMGLCFAL